MIALFLSAGVGFVVFMIGFGLKYRAKTIASRRAEEGQKSTARASAHA